VHAKSVPAFAEGPCRAETARLIAAVPRAFRRLRLKGGRRDFVVPEIARLPILTILGRTE